MLYKFKVKNCSGYWIFRIKTKSKFEKIQKKNMDSFYRRKLKRKTAERETEPSMLLFFDDFSQVNSFLLLKR
jgi:hypothetical protein